MPEQPGSAPSSPLFAEKQAAVGIRAVHLDLKGLPPTIDRLLSLLDLLAAARCNAVVVEWEDMFPWTCDERFRCTTAYTPEEIGRFHDKAAQLGIEIIPLVQCLGHLQTPLKFPEYAHLREVPDRVDVLNPLAAGARELVEKMVLDVLSLLPDVKHFHLGGDEAWTFGSHPDTKAYIEKHGKGALYMHHVEPLLDLLNGRGIRPILWHDMMTHWDSAPLNHLQKKADLCVWGYDRTPDTISEQVHYHVSHIERFHAHGITMWGGTAYKGADGSDSELPNLERRKTNVVGWTDVAKRFSMKGIIITAWSRYNTMITQVEPIDSSLDALVLSLATVYNGVPPEMAAVNKFLESAGEMPRFQACHESVAKLSRLKYSAWNTVRYIRQNLACGRIDRDRFDPATYAEWKSDIARRVDQLEQVKTEMLAAFSGLVPEIWIDRFAEDRIQPIREEATEIARMVG